jgi:hypothetical protein
MNEAQDKRKKAYLMKEEITIENLFIQGFLIDLIEITHLLTQQGIFVHLKIQGAFEKCLLLGIK